MKILTNKKISLIVSLLLTVLIYSNNELDKIVVKLKLDNVETKEVLNQITKQTGYEFIYTASSVDNSKKISINADSESLTKVLDLIVKSQDLTYTIKSKEIALKKRKKINKQVTGLVLDQSGEPLPGVNIIVKGTMLGTISDVDGKFKLDLTDAEMQVLLVKSMGYKTIEQKVGAQNTFSFKLLEDATDIEEVIVVGYGTQKKVNVSGAVESVSVKALEARPVTDITKGLQGLAAGLNINVSNGRAASTASINVRGYESINGGEPLIIIDGMSASTRELANLNPIDVKSISVLKDAASAAIYGSRAAFGVVLVETKRGKGKMKVTVSSTMSFSKPTFLPETITDPLISYQAKHDAAYPYYDLYNSEIEYAKKMKEDPENYPQVRVNPNDPTSWQFFYSTNWHDEVFKDYNVSQLHNMSISGQSEETGLNYYLSSAYSRNGGLLIKGSDVFEKYNLRSNLSVKLFDFLSIGNNTSITNTNYSEPISLDFHQINRTDPSKPVYNPDGTYTSTGANVIGRLENGGRNDEKKTFLKNKIYAELDFFDGAWKINADLSIKRFFVEEEEYNIPVAYGPGPGQELKYTSPTTYSERDYENTEYTGVNIFTTFYKNFNDHDITLLLGYNQEENIYKERELEKKDLISPSLPSVALATGDSDVDESYKDWAVRGAFVRFNYVYDNRYVLEFNTRYDGTSKFPKDDRFAIYPSFSAAWRINEESFFPKNKYVSSAKMKFSWGELGNQHVGEYDYLSTMSSGKTSQIVNGKKPIGVYSPGLVASSLTWERVESKNFGIDLGFFKNRLNVGFDVYERYTKDMLTKSKTLPEVLGASEPKENAADLKNRGWGLTISWNHSIPLLGSNFSYRAKFNISDSRSWITRYDNPDNYLGDYYVGREIGEIWGLTSDGLFQSVEEVRDHAYQDHLASDEINRFYPGDVKWKDLDGDGKITKGTWRRDNSGDYSIIGNSSERFRYGINIDVSWYGFDLNVFAQGVGKKDWYPGSGNHYFWSILAQPWAMAQGDVYFNSWTPERRGAYFPRIKPYAAEDGHLELGIPQTRYLIDASYLRIKNISLGYNIPKKISNVLGIENLKFYVSGENLVTFSDLTDYDIDPEVLSGGGNYPLSKTYSVGLNVQF
jgi:TonB-linked SusC/RagA family outer membrane protein